MFSVQQGIDCIFNDSYLLREASLRGIVLKAEAMASCCSSLKKIEKFLRRNIFYCRTEAIQTTLRLDCVSKAFVAIGTELLING